MHNIYSFYIFMVKICKDRNLTNISIDVSSVWLNKNIFKNLCGKTLLFRCQNCVVNQNPRKCACSVPVFRNITRVIISENKHVNLICLLYVNLTKRACMQVFFFTPYELGLQHSIALHACTGSIWPKWVTINAGTITAYTSGCKIKHHPRNVINLPACRSIASSQQMINGGKKSILNLELVGKS